MDVALVAGEAGMVVHKADCPEARKAANHGVPVLTMFGIEGKSETLREYEWHSCMGQVGK
jgi:hypothetical protein